jgi:eukaryotic-like serine/threonine-protein kinase
VNGYRVVGKLGAGGMGIVYKATDSRLNRTVALKFLPPQIEADEQARSQLLREARAASRLDHPNVGAIHAIEETPDGRSFLVLAYYEGETLAQRLDRGPLPAAQAIGIARQIAQGLEEAHAHEIVHRDIKPSNVILTRQGVVKIVDFGLARTIQSADSTASAVASGTVSYMAPEQALGRPLDQRTDLWAVGVVLLRMLTGHLPFQGDNTPALLLTIAQSAPAHVDELPAELQAVVCRALAKNPAERYQTAADLAVDLGRLERSEEAMQTATIGVGALRQYRESASRSALAGPPPRRRRWYWIAAVAAVCATVLALPPVRERLWAPAGPGEKHIAVLPFQVLGINGGGEALADGVMETLTSRLSNLESGAKSLWVVPASEVRSRKVSDAAGALKMFGATLAVTGTVQRAGPTVRLLVNLIDTRRMAQLGSAEAEDRNGDFSQLEDAAVRKLAALMALAPPRETQGAATGAAAPAAYELYLQARGLIARFDRAGNLDQAIAQLRQATAADPGFALAFDSTAEAYLLKYRIDQNPAWLDQAAANAERAVRINGQLAPVFVTLGRIHLETGKKDLALEEFQHALELDPRSAEALAGLAAVYESQARPADAEQILKRATALRPDYWEGFSRLGIFYYRQHRYAEAVAAMQKVIEMTPDNAVGWLNLGAALRSAGRLEEAAAALDRSIKINPSYAALTNLGNLYYQQRRFADAAVQYEKALALNDKDYIPWLNLVHAYAWLNRSADAEACYRRALPLLEQQATLHPDNPTIQSKLGLTYVHLKDRARGFSHLEAAVALAPKDGVPMADTAEAYEVTGDRPNALAWLHKALAAGETAENIQNDPVLHRVMADPTLRPR